MRRFKQANQGKHTSRILRRMCLQIIEDPKSKTREKLQAAALLERVMRLSPRRKVKNGQPKKGASDTNGRIDGILRQANAA